MESANSVYFAPRNCVLSAIQPQPIKRPRLWFSNGAQPVKGARILCVPRHIHRQTIKLLLLNPSKDLHRFRRSFCWSSASMVPTVQRPTVHVDTQHQSFLVVMGLLVPSRTATFRTQLTRIVDLELDAPTSIVCIDIQMDVKCSPTHGPRKMEPASGHLLLPMIR